MSETIQTKIADYDKLPRCAGVYAIKNLRTGKSYVGKSLNIRFRIKQHYKMLSKRRRDERSKSGHPNNYLRESFNHFGENYFVVEILEEFDSDSLGFLEIRQKLEFAESKWMAFYLQNGFPLYNVEIPYSVELILENILKIKVNPILRRYSFINPKSW